MTKVLDRQRTDLGRLGGLKYLYGKKDFLDGFHRARPGGRFHAATLVGLDCNHPDSRLLLVGCVPK